jgi:hypothetical protein
MAEEPADARSKKHAARLKVLSALGLVSLLVWVAWWADAFLQNRLFLADRTWLQIPGLGADFWTQSELAARKFAAGIDPYASKKHLFHYPPLVIRLFLWVQYFTPAVALRIWIAVCGALIALAAVVAHRTRARLGLEPVPLTVALAAVLFSFPVVFEMERANFDVITLAALLAALPLLEKKERYREILAGCLLAVGPWVKLYPGLMGVGLIGLRRFWVLGGFAAAGVGIGLLTPSETLRSFEILDLAMKRVSSFTPDSYFPWSHSVSMLWLEMLRILPPGAAGVLGRIPASVVGGAVVLAAAGVVCKRVFHCPRSEPLTYPLLLWVLAVASCAPVIANDYSLLFLPLAAVAVWSRKDPRAVHAGLLLSLLWWQPFMFPINPLFLLMIKLGALAAVGLAITLRAAELGGEKIETAPVTSAVGAS